MSMRTKWFLLVLLSLSLFGGLPLRAEDPPEHRPFMGDPEAAAEWVRTLEQMAQANMEFLTEPWHAEAHGLIGQWAALQGAGGVEAENLSIIVSQLAITLDLAGAVGGVSPREQENWVFDYFLHRRVMDAQTPASTRAGELIAEVKAERQRGYGPLAAYVPSQRALGRMIRLLLEQTNLRSVWIDRDLFRGTDALRVIDSLLRQSVEVDFLLLRGLADLARETDPQLVRNIFDEFIASHYRFSDGLPEEYAARFVDVGLGWLVQRARASGSFPAYAESLRRSEQSIEKLLMSELSREGLADPEVRVMATNLARVNAMEEAFGLAPRAPFGLSTYLYPFAGALQSGLAANEEAGEQLTAALDFERRLRAMNERVVGELHPHARPSAPILFSAVEGPEQEALRRAIARLVARSIEDAAGDMPARGRGGWEMSPLARGRGEAGQRAALLEIAVRTMAAERGKMEKKGKLSEVAELTHGALYLSALERWYRTGEAGGAHADSALRALRPLVDHKLFRERLPGR
jgi:hypothetical protein